MSFGTIQRNVLAAVPGIPLQVVKSFINNVYSDLGKRWEWSAMERTYPLSTFSRLIYSADNTSFDAGLTVTNGSASCTSIDDFSSIASGASHDLTVHQFYIRINGEPQVYKLNTCAFATPTYTLTLERVYNGDTPTAAVAYEIFQPIYPVVAALADTTPTIRELLSIRYRSNLEEVDQTRLNEIDPERRSMGDPTHYSKLGKNSYGQLLVELWPRPTDNITLSMRVRTEPTALSADTDLALLDENLIALQTSVNLAPMHMRLFPDDADTTASSLKIWSQQAMGLFNDLMMEDIRNHSSSEQVRDTQTSASPTDVYYGNDISGWTSYW